jgi:phosphohistidine phosphatase
MRHGNAENTADDFYRSLTNFGKKEVLKNTLELNKQQIIPDLVFYSNALRTKETFNIFLETTKYKNKSTEKAELYVFFNNAEFLNNFIKPIENTISTIMFIGHNPTLSNILQVLTKQTNIYMNTASIFVLDFDVDNWANIEIETAQIYFSIN